MSHEQQSKSAGSASGMIQLVGQMMMLPMTIMASGMNFLMQEMQKNSTSHKKTSAEGSRGTTTNPAEKPTKEEKGMQMLVTFEVFDTIIESERFREAREATHRQLEIMLKSGKVLASGAFSDRRGGFVFLEVDSGEDLLRFLAPGFSDNCHIETYPVLPWDKQGEVMAQIFKDLASN